MGYHKLIQDNVKNAFNTIGDIAENITFTNNKVDGYNFLYPKYYFRDKNWPRMGGQNDWERDRSDWEGIVEFFDIGSHLDHPFNQLTEEQLGVEYLKRYTETI